MNYVRAVSKDYVPRYSLSRATEPGTTSRVAPAPTSPVASYGRWEERCCLQDVSCIYVYVYVVCYEESKPQKRPWRSRKRGHARRIANYLYEYQYIYKEGQQQWRAGV